MLPSFVWAMGTCVQLRQTPYCPVRLERAAVRMIWHLQMHVSVIANPCLSDTDTILP